MNNATCEVFSPYYGVRDYENTDFITQMPIEGKLNGRGFYGDHVLLVPTASAQHELSNALLFSAVEHSGQLVVRTCWGGIPPLLYSYAPREERNEAAGSYFCMAPAEHVFYRALRDVSDFQPLVPKQGILALNGFADIEVAYTIEARRVFTLPCNVPDGNGAFCAMAHVGYVLDEADRTATLCMTSIVADPRDSDRRWFGMQPGQRALTIGSVCFVNMGGKWTVELFQHMHETQKIAQQREDIAYLNDIIKQSAFENRNINRTIKEH